MVARELTAHQDLGVLPPSTADLSRQRWMAVPAVVVASASVATHGWMLIEMPATRSLHVVVLAMAAACLWCAVCLVRRPRVQEWAATAVMGAAMVGVHLMLTGPDSQHHSMQGMPSGHDGSGGAMSTALVLALVEMVVALAAIWRITSRSRPQHLAESPRRGYL